MLPPSCIIELTTESCPSFPTDNPTTTAYKTQSHPHKNSALNMPQEAIAQDLVAKGNEVLFAFRRALGSFAQHLDDSGTSSPVEATCKAELQRFQLWAINLGLFQASHNSLEYRLRQNATVRSLIAALLTDLCLSLDDRKSTNWIRIVM